MNQFTLFFGRLVELVGAEKAAALINEFAGTVIPGNKKLNSVDAKILSEFNGGNQMELSVKHGVSSAYVFRLIKKHSTDDFGFPCAAPIIGQNYKPISGAEAKTITDKLVQESTRRNGKTLLGPEDSIHLLVMRRVSNRLTINVSDIEYDVSHIPDVAVGDLITVIPASLPRLDLSRFAFAAEPLPVNNHGDEKNPAATDPQDQSSDREPLAAYRRAEAFPLHHREHSPEGAAYPTPDKSPATLPAHETQSEVHPIDPANVDRP